jgi:hypothetical protein
MVRTVVSLLLFLSSFLSAYAQRGVTSINVATHRIAFSFDEKLAKSYRVDSVEANAGGNGLPAHLVVTLRDSYVRERPSEPEFGSVPRIYVIPVGGDDDAVIDSFPSLRRSVSELRRLLGRRSLDGPVPIFPLVTEHQELTVRHKILRFRNGRGISFVTQLSDRDDPITNDRLLYMFEGMTDDNAWIVSLVFPCEAVGLPGSSPDAVIDEAFPAYLKHTSELVERLQSRNFYPSIVTIENILRSLKVTSR